MIHKTRKRKPFLCTFVSDNIFPPLIDLKMLVLAYPTVRFLLLAATAIRMSGAATITAGFKNLFQVVCFPSESFGNSYLNPAPYN